MSTWHIKNLETTTCRFRSCSCCQTLQVAAKSQLTCFIEFLIGRMYAAYLYINLETRDFPKPRVLLENVVIFHETYIFIGFWKTRYIYIYTKIIPPNELPTGFLQNFFISDEQVPPSPRSQLPGGVGRKAPAVPFPSPPPCWERLFHHGPVGYSYWNHRCRDLRFQGKEKHKSSRNSNKSPHFICYPCRKQKISHQWERKLFFPTAFGYLWTSAMEKKT